MNQIFKTVPRHLKASSSFSFSFNFSRLLATTTNRQYSTPQPQEPSKKRIYKKKIDINLGSFILLCKDLEKRSFSTIADLQEKIEKDLANKEKEVSPQNRDILELIALSCTDKDIDFLADVVRRHAMKVYQNGNPHKLMTYGRQFMQMLVSLKKTDKLIEVVRDRRNNVLFRHHSTTEIVLNHLSEEGMNNEICELLVERLPRYFRTIYTTPTDIDTDNNKKRMRVSHIPFTHMDIYTKALLDLDSEKAYTTFKEMVDYIYKNDGEVSKHVVLRLLFYSIKMKQARFGFNIFYTDIFQRDDVLKANLMVMLHSISGSEEKVIQNLRNVFNKNVPIYQYTFKVIRDDIRQKGLSDEYKNNIDMAYKRALRNNLFAEKDLIEIVYDTPDETPDIFETKKEISE